MSSPSDPGSQQPNPWNAPSLGTPPQHGPTIPQAPSYSQPAPPVPYGQPPYGQPGYGAPMPPGTNGLAIASLVLGIVWVYWIGSILALIFGYVARRQIRENHQNGSGMAMAGIVLGWVGVGFLILFILLGVLAGSGVFASA